STTRPCPSSGSAAPAPASTSATPRSSAATGCPGAACGPPASCPTSPSIRPPRIPSSASSSTIGGRPAGRRADAGAGCRDEFDDGASMMRIAGTLPAAGAALSAPRAVPAQTPAGATLADLGFMAGCWRGEFANGGALEEVYTAPSSNLMLGLSRFLRGDRAVQFEFTRITADSTGIALLPFPGGRPSEHAFRLTVLEPGRATF